MKVEIRNCPKCGKEATNLILNLYGIYQVHYFCQPCKWEITSEYYDWEIENLDELEPVFVS